MGLPPKPSAEQRPARSKMVTTLIAQMSDLLAPISKSTTRTWSNLYDWVCARYLVGVKGAETT